MRFRFGDFELDDESRELRRSGARQPLSPKAYELLLLLLNRRPAAVGRGELLDLIWPDAAVGYTSLPRVVAELRRALGDEARAPRFLRTVHGFGYAFDGPVREAPRRGRSEFPCSLVHGGRAQGLVEGETLLGRGEECAVRIDSGTVSRRHACIVVSGRQAKLQDLASKNGTFLNGQRIPAADPVTLKEADEIVIGAILLVFREGYGPGSTVTG